MDGSDLTHDNMASRFTNVLSVECDGHGSVNITEPDGHISAGRCPVCEDAQVKEAVRAFIPPRFACTIDLPVPVLEWTAKGPKAQGLYLTGQVGTGKTHTAWETLGRWCMVTGTCPRRDAEGPYGHVTPPVVFTRMTDLLDDLRPGDAARQRVRDCQNTRLLVLDDLGAEKASEWTQERLYSIIDHRYALCLPLIVTSNLPPAKVAEQTGQRTASRLAEMCRVIRMTGPDRRHGSAA